MAAKETTGWRSSPSRPTVTSSLASNCSEVMLEKASYMNSFSSREPGTSYAAIYIGIPATRLRTAPRWSWTRHVVVVATVHYVSA